MSNLPTPETDAIISVGLENADEECVPAEFGRKLERERDEARNKMADALQEVDLRTLDFERMKQERDEARENLDEEMKFHHRTHSELVNANCKLLDNQNDNRTTTKSFLAGALAEALENE